MPIHIIPDAYYTQQEVRKELKVGQDTITKLEIQNQLTPFQLGRSLLYKGEDIIEAMEQGT
ncbi:hypothetical protein MFLO_14767 [Listeria floridensis FSL S10-1187]|uniref:DNA-binding protein n=1 Tax=Listeria floridensis FSL S10-1187 TaxID=1265817 RepID=A0ABN0RC37_9LIST|nr:helix-turn-helix domain-containing protein [Listeria floridensis]EUJ25790.1 hypothetical protein MFLO_14767 [Listeria floridensis FSL S10-1187]